MEKNYYVKNLLLALSLFAIGTAIWWYDNSFSTRENLIYLLLSSASLLLFPFSRKLIEQSALKFSSSAFWNRGLFVETPGKNGLYALFYLLCMATAIPLGGTYCVYLLTKR
ncbi:colicin E1 family microcin immunity protein [Pseudomonas rubra]|uniref:Colicin E1 immunity protein n=1 Tax=Pseudomonas rubra TaxID=2942627 RepID=A0ABT5P951_9PSED|nr:colicin E1 family microcin immunity protein [Pseudomonas rubra]MDD1014687.1 colicin E1 immunity protein [Pseudomonas rubra]MDD1040864.1 colicin E1 immunity protein [Pseudomonas rubra]MDD1157606.1 colicin E1 immunity protein [Pseudomonas rubra]